MSPSWSRSPFGAPIPALQPRAGHAEPLSRGWSWASGPASQPPHPPPSSCSSLRPQPTRGMVFPPSCLPPPPPGRIPDPQAPRCRSRSPPPSKAPGASPPTPACVQREQGGRASRPHPHLPHPPPGSSPGAPTEPQPQALVFLGSTDPGPASSRPCGSAGRPLPPPWPRVHSGPQPLEGPVARVGVSGRGGDRGPLRLAPLLVCRSSPGPRLCPARCSVMERGLPEDKGPSVCFLRAPC